MECSLKTERLFHQEKVVVEQLYIASRWWQRMRGLLGRSPLTKTQGLLISQCNSVHMVGMKYPIDVVYLDKQERVVKVVECLKPWRFSSCLKAKSVIELSAGRAKEMNLSVGSTFERREVE